MENNFVEMRNISKSFPGVIALNNVSFSVRKGEVHGILGENGAGKSTLIKVLGAIYKPDKGEIYIDGELAHLNTVRDAQEKGISVIHQELMLVPHLSIADNLFMSSNPSSYGFYNQADQIRRARELLNTFGIDLDPSRLISSISVAQQQLVEIIKAISVNAHIIVMDEPTSSLETSEVTKLFEFINRLKADGVSIIYISHKLDELFTITDRITVMRDGETVDTVNTAEVSPQLLIRMMVARDLSDFYSRTDFPKGEKILSVNNLNRKKVLKDITFDLYKGEILGFSGLIGAGRTELMKAIFGLDPIDSGQIMIDGKEVKLHSPEDAMKAGISLVPENRKEEGLILKNSVGFNLTLTVLKEFIKGIFVHRKKEADIMQLYKEKLGINTPSFEQKVANLSGGNQQKVVVSKWLATHPRILLLDEPTRGIDVGAKAEIYSIMNDLTLNGMSIIMVSSEMQEVMAMSDRICVMRDGAITKILEKKDFSQETILSYAIGETK